MNDYFIGHLASAILLVPMRILLQLTSKKVSKEEVVLVSYSELFGPSKALTATLRLFSLLEVHDNDYLYPERITS